MASGNTTVRGPTTKLVTTSAAPSHGSFSRQRGTSIMKSMNNSSSSLASNGGCFSSKTRRQRFAAPDVVSRQRDISNRSVGIGPATKDRRGCRGDVGIAGVRAQRWASEPVVAKPMVSKPMGGAAFQQPEQQQQQQVKRVTPRGSLIEQPHEPRCSMENINSNNPMRRSVNGRAMRRGSARGRVTTLKPTKSFGKKPPKQEPRNLVHHGHGGDEPLNLVIIGSERRGWSERRGLSELTFDESMMDDCASTITGNSCDMSLLEPPVSTISPHSNREGEVVPPPNTIQEEDDELQQQMRRAMKLSLSDLHSPPSLSTITTSNDGGGEVEESLRLAMRLSTKEFISENDVYINTQTTSSSRLHEPNLLTLTSQMEKPETSLAAAERSRRELLREDSTAQLAMVLKLSEQETAYHPPSDTAGKEDAMELAMQISQQELETHQALDLAEKRSLELALRLSTLGPSSESPNL